MGGAMSSRNWRRRGGEGGVMLPLLALQVLMEYGRSGSRKPPVTAALILANTLVFLRPGPLHSLLPPLSAVAFNPHLILQHGDLKRFFLSAFYHMGEAHLFYNMISLLWKGVQLETLMGSVDFASMVAALLALSQGISLLLAKGLLHFFGDETYYDLFAVGFSGVLFAMKVVLNSRSDEFAYLHGMVIPAKYAAWAELILIQVFIPGTSFLGHLGGILAGLVYLRLKESFHGPDPLALLISGVLGIVSWPVRFFRGLLQSGRPQGRISGSGRAGHRTIRITRGTWRCPACTYDNSAAVDVCEMCSTVREDHGFAPRRHQQSGRGASELSVEELRRRRLERFSR